ncbi:hypothetical protein Pres01_20680 [Metapseudomonas resinovorans]|nr:hypothetical protein Pres01_20680 [Pseudomonas resinovorans]
MIFSAQLPDWLVACFRIALLGEIYPNIRAVAVGYNENGSVLIRYYLDRQPTDFDLESLEVVATNLDSMGGKKFLSIKLMSNVFMRRALSEIWSRLVGLFILDESMFEFISKYNYKNNMVQKRKKPRKVEGIVIL